MGVISFLGHLLTMTNKERIVFTRYPVRILASITTPLFFILLSGFTYASFGNQSGPSIATSMFISVLGLVYLTVSQYASQAVIEDQQQGTIESLFLAPIPKFTDILAKMIVRYSFVTITIFGYYGVLRYLFGPIPLNHLGLGVILVGCLIGQSIFISFILAGLTLRYKETAVRIGFIFPFLVLIFSGMFIPISALPKNAQLVAYLLPFTYTTDALREALIAPEVSTLILPFSIEVLFSIFLGVVLPVLGALYYLRLERSARYTGTLLEY